jgi:hypothetical protein
MGGGGVGDEKPKALVVIIVPRFLSFSPNLGIRPESRRRVVVDHA